MASSGTFSFNPAASDLIITAFSRGCGKSATELNPEMLRVASHEANLQNVEWANLGYNLWKQETIQFPSNSTLVQGVGQYVLPATTLMVTLAWTELNPGVQASQTDLVMGALSAVEFKSITNKLFQGRPTSYWYDRQIIPLMNLWPVPDGAGPYTAFCQAFTQIQDVVLPSGITLDAPWRFLDAFTCGLARRLAVHYAPARVGTPGKPGIPGTGLWGEYEIAWLAATTADAENRPLVIMPDLSGYFRP
jgi:hypothetical protein